MDGWCCWHDASLGRSSPPPRGGLTYPTHHERLFGQPCSEIPQAPLELGPLDLIGAQLDRRLVGARSALAIIGAPEQFCMGGMQRLVALERWIVQQRR